MARIQRARTTVFLSMVVWLALSGSAVAQDYLKYEFTGSIAAFTDANATTTQRMTDAGMGIGSTCRATAYVDPNAVDENAETNKSSYQTDYISFAIGGSDPLFEANGFQRDSYVALQLGVTVDGIPFPVSGFGWAGSEPTNVTGPAFLAFNAQAESSPGAGDSKGHLLALAGFAGALTSVELPTAVGQISGLNLLRKLYVDVIDVDESNAPFQIDCNLTTTSVTLEPLPVVEVVPLSDQLGVLALSLLLVGTGAFMARRLLFAHPH